MMSSYEERILIPVEGNETIDLFTYSGLLVAKGYERIVIGKRGPYVEFDDRHICLDSIHVPEGQKWRWDSPLGYYYEYRTNDSWHVKIYRQKALVDYADYKIGKWYISPFHLCTKNADGKLQFLIERSPQLSLF